MNSAPTCSNNYVCVEILFELRFVFIVTLTKSFPSIVALRTLPCISIVHIPFLGRCIYFTDSSIYAQASLCIRARSASHASILLHPKPLIVHVVANQTHRISLFVKVLRVETF